ncbi:MAG: cupredoxin domain-containing protein [Chloroflexota bacterium]
MKIKKLGFIVLAGLMLVLAACQSADAGPTVIHVTLSEFAVMLDTDSVPAGHVTIEIENTGALAHELVLEAAGSKDEPFETDGVASEAEDIEPGTTVSFEWDLEPGEYQLACYVEGHFEAGMIQAFTVK